MQSANKICDMKRKERKMKKNLKKVMGFFLVAAMSITLLVGCGSSNPSSTEGDTKAETGAEQETGNIKIGISMESLESQFLVMNHEAMVKKAEELGVEVVVSIAEGDPTKQNQQIEDLIAQGCQTIICFPKDGASIASAVKKAQDAGVNFIMNNRSIQSDDVVPELQVLADNEKMAYDIVSWFAEKAKEEGEQYEVILLVGNLGDGGAVARQAGHKKALEENADVFNLVSEIPTEWDHEITLKGLQNALQANPDANLIITPSDFLYPPIRAALEQANRWAVRGEDNHCTLLTFDGDEVGMQYLKDGYSAANAAQDPVFEGEKCVEWAVKMAQGEYPPENIIYDNGILVTMDNLEEVGPTIWSWSMVE